MPRSTGEWGHKRGKEGTEAREVCLIEQVMEISNRGIIPLGEINE